jgi:hypothetical protein
MGITEVQAALEIYFDVMYDCDMEKFDRIFHPTCTLFTGQDGALTVRPFQQYRQEMASRTAPRTAGQSREAERIVKIDMLAGRLGSGTGAPANPRKAVCRQPESGESQRALDDCGQDLPSDGEASRPLKPRGAAIVAGWVEEANQKKWPRGSEYSLAECPVTRGLARFAQRFLRSAPWQDRAIVLS